MYLHEATEVSRKIVENAVGIKFVQLKTTSFTNLERWFPQNVAAAAEKPPVNKIHLPRNRRSRVLETTF